MTGSFSVELGGSSKGASSSPPIPVSSLLFLSTDLSLGALKELPADCLRSRSCSSCSRRLSSLMLSNEATARPIRQIVASMATSILTIKTVLHAVIDRTGGAPGGGGAGGRFNGGDAGGGMVKGGETGGGAAGGRLDGGCGGEGEGEGSKYSSARAIVTGGVTMKATTRKITPQMYNFFQWTLVDLGSDFDLLLGAVRTMAFFKIARSVFG